MWEDLKKGLRNKTAWILFASLVVFVLKTYFNIDVPEEDLNKLVNLLLLTATAFGIFKSYN